MEENPDLSAASYSAISNSAESPEYAFPPEIEYYQPPRLAIIHLLAWLTVTAALLKLNSAMGMLAVPSAKMLASQGVAEKILFSINQILAAALFVGGTVFWIDRFRRKPGYLQPGHWIVGINSVFRLVALLHQIVFALALSRNIQPYLAYVTLYNIATVVCRAAVFICAAWRIPEKWRWKIAIGFEAIPVLWYFLLPLLMPSNLPVFRNLGIFISAPIVGVICLAILIDLAKGLRRDWLHWLGAALPLAYLATSIASEMLTAFRSLLGKFL